MVTNKFTSSQLKTIYDVFVEVKKKSKLKEGHLLLDQYEKIIKKTEGQLNDISKS
jgi:hypothetical protein